jgi:hypothetical protein
LVVAEVLALKMERGIIDSSHEGRRKRRERGPNEQRRKSSSNNSSGGGGGSGKYFSSDSVSPEVGFLGLNTLNRLLPSKSRTFKDHG